MRKHGWAPMAGLLAFALLAAACGGGEQAPAPAKEQAPAPATEEAADTEAVPAAEPEVPPVGDAKSRVEVELGDWYVKPEVTSVESGAVTFAVRTNAISGHELVVVRSDEPPGELPLDFGDFGPVNEAEQDVWGKTPVIGSDQLHKMTLELAPGKYILICNIGPHYSNGMWAGFEVT